MFLRDNHKKCWILLKCSHNCFCEDGITKLIRKQFMLCNPYVVAEQ